MAIAVCPTHADLSALLSGELHGERADEIERHIDSCLDCQNSLRSFKTCSHWVAETLKEGDKASSTLDSDCLVALERIRRFAPEASQTLSTVGVLGMPNSLQASTPQAAPRLP